MPPTQINRLGFEIECEMSKKLIAYLTEIKGGTVKNDGSLRSCCNNMNVKEFTSPTFTLDELPKIQEFFNILHIFYKKKEFHFNQSCGFHIHVSFNPQIPVEIISRQFVAYFKRALRQKQKKVMALRGDNRFCKLTISQHELTERYHSERYRFINIWPALDKHGTIEFRIFPSTNPKRMYRYILFTLKHIQEFMRKDFKVTLKARIQDTKIPEIKIEKSIKLTNLEHIYV